MEELDKWGQLYVSKDAPDAFLYFFATFMSLVEFEVWEPSLLLRKLCKILVQDVPAILLVKGMSDVTMRISQTSYRA